MRTCYTGFGRGFLSELLHLVGVVAATVLACAFHSPVSRFLASWVVMVSPPTMEFVSFLGLLALGLFVFVGLGARALAKRLTWDRLTWSVQGFGLLLGGARGVWWSGLWLLVLLGTGVPYLDQSIQERSLFSPRLLALSRATLTQVVDWSTGSRGEGPLIPTLEPHQR